MKRLITLVMLVASVMLFSIEASAQFDLSRALGSLLGSSTQTEDAPNPYDAIAEAAPSKSRILGTWQYKTASMEYLGNNQLAGAAISQLEGFALGELKKMGVVEGCCSLTLRRNGMAVISTLDALQEGSFTYDETSARVTATTMSGGESFSFDGYIKMVSENLVVLIDARDVLDAMVKASPELATNQSVVMARAVLDSFTDIYIGVIFKR